MNNQYTRKEEKCMLSGNDFCDRNDKDCCICIADEEKWADKQCREEMKK